MKKRRFKAEIQSHSWGNFYLERDVSEPDSAEPFINVCSQTGVSANQWPVGYFTPHDGWRTRVSSFNDSLAWDSIETPVSVKDFAKRIGVSQGHARRIVSSGQVTKLYGNGPLVFGNVGAAAQEYFKRRREGWKKRASAGGKGKARKNRGGE